MNIKYDKELMIFRNDGQYGAIYSFGISKKKQDGTYENGYIPCKFRKDISLENKSKIIIKDAWLTFNVKDKKTIPYVFINSFDIVNNDTNKKKEDAFEEFSKEADFSDLPDPQLPF